ncbi:tRNA uridine-5-carboxymethylaminomethyl(34) synthesis enzyme MnmG [Mesomycoplasma moatsii]|uniref:tRNA uridine-5-carboxymethylaminomethyl(34) synthesis enzyme MnmG n=1 Tax=Mesomycoplasma moatsii TaxID=171287 RepID=UPI0003B4F0F9
MNNKFDAIIVGGGHAGIEAVFALAKNGFKVALISLNKKRLAMLPCNPSIGGPAKGIITREIDALGGVQGYFADKAMIQIKMLNTSKGPAVRALRAQIDKDKYSQIVLEEIEKNKNITIIEAIVEEIVQKNNVIQGVKLNDGSIIESKVVIITTGTYMDSRILRGNDITISGPDGEKTTKNLSKSLKENGIDLIRLKTGTPARIYADSINWNELEEEILPLEDLTFSSKTKNKLKAQIHCWLTYTNQKTHQIILDNISKSAMYSGLIEGVGPRYCPSIEDKIVKFSHKERHQIFFEPETEKQDIYYINGCSTSMPIEIQDQFLRTIPGLKNCKVQKYGYAIEYDAVTSGQIYKSLESKKIKNLYFAGQINGTSGYEEAAGQGIVAGINAALKLKNKKPLDLKRNDSYIGVLIDDLVLKGTKEPYRMLTSRAEYRLLLRNDNADIRMSEYALYADMINEIEYQKIKEKYFLIDQKIKELENIYLSANDPLAKKYSVLNGASILKVIARPDVDYNDFINDFIYKDELIIKIRLDGYVQKQNKAAAKMLRLEELKIPKNINYDEIANLALEARYKLKKINPQTIGQASRISGINPSDIEMILFYINLKYKR